MPAGRNYFFLATAFLLFAFIAACENDIEKIKIITQRDNLPSESAKNINILYSDSGNLQMQVNSPIMDRYTGKDPYIEMPKGVKILFFGEDKKIRSWLTSNYAIRRENERTMEAKRNVIVVNEKGEKLNTEQLIWDEQKQMIYSQEFVRITTADEIIYGDGFESNQEFTRYKIFNIKGTISLKDQQNAPQNP